MASQKQHYLPPFPDTDVALEEAYRDVWQYSRRTIGRPELDKDVAETLTALCKSARFRPAGTAAENSLNSSS